MTQEIYRSGCWGCLKAQQDPTKKYICPRYQQHQKEYNKIYEKFD